MKKEIPVKQQIHDVIRGIMINDGPDGHTDGSGDCGLYSSLVKR